MERCMPRSKKEGLFYGSIICLLTSTIMATINMSINLGEVSKEVLFLMIKALPIVFIIAIVCETFLISKIVNKLMYVFTSTRDSFNSYIMFRTFFTVTFMSIFMTLVGGALETGLSIEVLKTFPISWPRNFCLVLFLQLIIVQPIARRVMLLLHSYQDKNIVKN